jgi:ribosomal protein S18 acetylase RimI-like enzyme
MTTATLTLRSIHPEDQPFLYEVYASTRTEELAPLGWNSEQQAAFLTQQFNAQHQYYQASYASADFQIILVNGQPAGRLYVERGADELRLIDIALLPEYRNAGIGTGLIKNLLAEAQQAGKPVRIHVEKFNPALRLYKRLGFSIIDDRGVYWFMEWKPQEVNSAAQRGSAPRNDEQPGLM